MYTLINNTYFRVSRIVCSVLLLVISLITVGSAYAVNMDSDQYRIQFGTISIGGGTMNDLDNDTYTLTTTLGQSAAKQFQSNGYVIRAGFQYVYSRIPFSFSLSKTRVDFGSLLPNVPVTDTIDIEVSFGGGGQYIVTVAEEGPLKKFNSTAFIPNTTCDGGVNTCSVSAAKPWTLTSAYGLGYGMYSAGGEDFPADFSDVTYFRPFPDKTNNELPAIIMSNSNITMQYDPTLNPSPTPAPQLTGVARDILHAATMTLKTNISPTQDTGSYTNVLHFTATPSF